MRVRFARPEDAETILNGMLGIAESMGEREKVVSTPDTIRRFGFGPERRFESLIAEAGGRPVGVCVFFPSFSTYRGQPGAYVQDLYVHPLFRGQGVGAKLLGQLAAIVSQRGGSYIRLSVDTENHAAQTFYDRLGLRHSVNEQIHAAYGEDFLVLARAGEAQAEDWTE